MGRKEEYKLQNEQFMQTLRTEADVHELPCGILYKVLEEGTGAATPRSNSVVSVHYKGTLINGREFDNFLEAELSRSFSSERGYRRMADCSAKDAGGRSLDRLHPL